MNTDLLFRATANVAELTFFDVLLGNFSICKGRVFGVAAVLAIVPVRHDRFGDEARHAFVCKDMRRYGIIASSTCKCKEKMIRLDAFPSVVKNGQCPIVLSSNVLKVSWQSQGTVA